MGIGFREGQSIPYYSSMSSDIRFGHLNHFAATAIVENAGDPVRNRTGISGLGNLSSIRLSYGVV